jgi:hypothetical protein
MVISPLSAGGFGRQLLPSKARIRVVNPKTGSFREVVFLTRTAGPPQSWLWGLLVYNTDSGLLGIDLYQPVALFCSSIRDDV